MNPFSEGTQNILMMLVGTGPVVKMVLLALVAMSIISWAIIYAKFRLIASSSKKSEEFLDLYNSSGDMKTLLSYSAGIGGPVAEIFRTGYSEVVKTEKEKKKQSELRDDSGNGFSSFSPKSTELVERAIRKTMASECSNLEKSLVFLATTGSSAPFIGLFGTVWGIMNSFIGIAGSKGVPSLEVVAPGIAEALIATAVGLAAAIPATVAYNYFTSKIRAMEVEMENFCAGFLNATERYLNR